MSGLKKTLDDWANKLAKKAAENSTPLQESTDAFKAVTAYYAAQQKARKNQGDDEPDTEGFSFAGSNEVVNGGNPAVRARRNS